MTNSLKLKSLIVEKGFTQQSLANQMGISFASLNMKIHNKRQFKAKEISLLCNLLTIRDVHEIFFV